MKRVSETVKTLMNKLAANPRVRYATVSTAAVLFLFQLYFVRELIAAELLFALGFAVIFVLGGVFYLVGALSERWFDWTEVSVRVLASSARRGYVALEELGRKPFRHPRSESAQ